jgi:FixJ family two-component response regulator
MNSPRSRGWLGTIVFVVDDDASIRESLKTLIRSVGLQVELFGSG